MKIKLDFVSNSSSASFLVFDKTGESETMKYDIDDCFETDLLHILDYDVHDNETSKDILKEELPYYIKNEELSEKISRALSYADGKLYRLHASDQNNSVIEAGLCCMGLEDSKFLSDDFILIQGDGGY